jgi:hypothetical protein
MQPLFKKFRMPLFKVFRSALKDQCEIGDIKQLWFTTYFRNVRESFFSLSFKRVGRRNAFERAETNK